MTTIERVSERAALGECPLWCADEGVLYWEDIDGRAIHRYDPSSGATTSRTLPGRPGSFVLTQAPGRLLVASEHELVWLDWASGETTPWLSLEAAGTGNRMNDGRCDPAGRYIVGSMFEDPEDGRATGIVHRIDAAGTVETLRTDVGVTNGIAFDARRGRMYFADTHTASVVVSDYDATTGAITNERPFLDYAPLPGLPDGACVDADGCYWSAAVTGWAVIRVTPDGTVDRVIDVPVQMPSMPAFGGTDLTTLFVTSIDPGPGAEPARDGFEHGALLAIEADTTGVPEPRFGGG